MSPQTPSDEIGARQTIVLDQGRVMVAGVPSKSLPLATVAKAAVRSRALADAGGPGLNACAFHYPGTVAWAFGVHAVALEVDIETCALRLLKYVAAHDCGRPINPMVVEGQIHGGLAQGIGTALGEEMIYDEAGQLLTGTFMDFRCRARRTCHRCRSSTSISPPPSTSSASRAWERAAWSLPPRSSVAQ